MGLGSEGLSSLIGVQVSHDGVIACNVGVTSRVRQLNASWEATIGGARRPCEPSRTGSPFPHQLQTIEGVEMSIATSPAAKAASLACSVVLFTLAACGGGGEAPPDETKAEAPTERALARPTPPGGTVIDADCRLKGFASLALQRINSYRASGATCGERGTFAPTTPLAWNAALIASSTRLSKDMAANNFFSHIGSVGSDLVQRVNDVGYVWYALGENIAAGQRTV